MSRYKRNISPWDDAAGALKVTPIDNVDGVDRLTSAGNWFIDAPWSAAGPAVTDKTAMRVAAVYGCVNKIAGCISGLPIHIYQKSPNGERERIDHDYSWLLNNEPTPQYTAATAWDYLIASKLLRGNGYFEIKRRSSKSATVDAVVPLDSHTVRPVLSGNRLVYAINQIGSDRRIIDQDDMIHIPGFGFDGLTGMSVISYAAKNDIGIALAADNYSAEFFANGARPDFLIAADGPLTEKQAIEYARIWASRHTGVGNHHQPAFLGNGMKVQNISLNAEDSQLLETRKFEVVQICTAFGVPPHLIGFMEGTTAWGSGLEELTRGFMLFTLLQHINVIEQELNRKLFRKAPIFCEFEIDAFMQGDSRAQGEYFNKALGGPGAQGWMSVNEVRKLKNLPPDTNADSNTVIRAGNNMPGAPDNAQ